MQVVQTKEEGSSASIVVISILSAVILGLLGFIAFKFRAGTKAVPPVSEKYEVRQVEVVELDKEVAAP